MGKLCFETEKYPTHSEESQCSQGYKYFFLEYLLSIIDCRIDAYLAGGGAREGIRGRGHPRPELLLVSLLASRNATASRLMTSLYQGRACFSCIGINDMFRTFENLIFREKSQMMHPAKSAT